jgi:hypothetical protein
MVGRRGLRPLDPPYLLRRASATAGLRPVERVIFTTCGLRAMVGRRGLRRLTHPTSLRYTFDQWDAGGRAPIRLTLDLRELGATPRRPRRCNQAITPAILIGHCHFAK